MKPVRAKKRANYRRRADLMLAFLMAVLLFLYAFLAVKVFRFSNYNRNDVPFRNNVPVHYSVGACLDKDK